MLEARADGNGRFADIELVHYNPVLDTSLRTCKCNKGSESKNYGWPFRRTVYEGGTRSMASSNSIFATTCSTIDDGTCSVRVCYRR